MKLLIRTAEMFDKIKKFYSEKLNGMRVFIS